MTTTDEDLSRAAIEEGPLVTPEPTTKLYDVEVGIGDGAYVKTLLFSCIFEATTI